MSTDPEDSATSGGVLSHSEIAQLQALVSTDLKFLLDANIEEEVNYAELLKRLNSTDAMAQGVEQKLDSILENLDALLESLGGIGEVESPQNSTKDSEKPAVQAQKI